MIYENLEFHNVVDLEQRKGFSGLQLQRYPKLVRDKMSERGRWNSQMTSGSEIRLVTDAENIRLFVSSLEGDAEILVFCGDILHSQYYLEPGYIKCVKVSPEPKLKLVKEKAFKGQRFSPKVWRFFFSGHQLMFHDIETYGHDYRPPNRTEKPALKWLAYGSSITAGTGSSRGDLSYPQITARRLGVDVLNMAQGGACMCEKGTADFFANRGDWDFATLEIGVNMRDIFSSDEFRERAEYLVNTMIDNNPGKPVILITAIINFIDYEKKESRGYFTQQEYDNILREIHLKNRDKGVFLIEGKNLINDFSGFNCDLVHPGPFGHIIIAENLAREIAGNIHNL